MTVNARFLRSLLFVPANSPRLFAKAAQRGADALILDLEDAVPADQKHDARANLSAAIDAFGSEVPVFVRVNPEPELLRQDIAALPMASIAGIMLPKVETAIQVQEVAEQLSLAPNAVAQTPIIPLIESPLAVVRLESIATAHPSIVALGFGGEDYAAAMGVAPDAEGLIWAAHAVTNAAHAFGLAAWGLPGSVAVISDTDAYTSLVTRARSIGFTGTVCIHPAQIALANKGFGPTEAELKWAQAVVTAGEQASAKGLGAAIVNGQMIDKPIIERARQWLALRDRDSA